jgi:hypothetical protein
VQAALWQEGEEGKELDLDAFWDHVQSVAGEYDAKGREGGRGGRREGGREEGGREGGRGMRGPRCWAWGEKRPSYEGCDPRSFPLPSLPPSLRPGRD